MKNFDRCIEEGCTLHYSSMEMTKGVERNEKLSEHCGNYLETLSLLEGDLGLSENATKSFAVVVYPSNAAFPYKYRQFWRILPPFFSDA
jgi:hypothetical protein